MVYDPKHRYTISQESGWFTLTYYSLVMRIKFDGELSDFIKSSSGLPVKLNLYQGSATHRYFLVYTKLSMETTELDLNTLLIKGDKHISSRDRRQLDKVEGLVTDVNLRCLIGDVRCQKSIINSTKLRRINPVVSKYDKREISYEIETGQLIDVKGNPRQDNGNYTCKIVDIEGHYLVLEYGQARSRAYKRVLRTHSSLSYPGRYTRVNKYNVGDRTWCYLEGHDCYVTIESILFETVTVRTPDAIDGNDVFVIDYRDLKCDHHYQGLCKEIMGEDGWDLVNVVQCRAGDVYCEVMGVPGHGHWFQRAELESVTSRTVCPPWASEGRYVHYQDQVYRIQGTVGLRCKIDPGYIHVSKLEQARAPQKSSKPSAPDVEPS